MRLFLTAFVSSLLVSLTALNLKAEKKALEGDLKKLQGIWQPITGKLFGNDMPHKTLDITKLILRYTNYITVVNNDAGNQGVFRLNESTDPKQLVMRGTAGPNKGKSYTCLYKFAGGRLVIAYGLDGVNAPKDFISRTSNTTCTIVYEKK